MEALTVYKFIHTGPIRLFLSKMALTLPLVGMDWKGDLKASR